MVKRMFTENWNRLLNKITTDYSYLEPYDELFANKTRKYFSKLAVYE
jgi:hypothetical protein